MTSAYLPGVKEPHSSVCLSTCARIDRCHLQGVHRRNTSLYEQRKIAPVFAIGEDAGIGAISKSHTALPCVSDLLHNVRTHHECFGNAGRVETAPFGFFASSAT